MAIPIERVSVDAVRKACTVKHQPMGADEELEVHAYREDGSYIYVPRQLGLTLCNRYGIEYEDHTSSGSVAVFPRQPEPRDYQIEPLRQVRKAMDNFYDFLFRARTGWGKTYGSLIVAARLGTTTLIIVDQDNLRDQWVKALKAGFGFTDETIGIIQGKTLKYEGCAVTVAMVQTLSQKRFPPEVYDAFGFILVDETHVIGAPTFSQVLLDFNGQYRMGVSATPKRHDALQKLLTHNLGRVRVYVEDQHAENSVYVMEHGSVYSFYANTSPKTGRFISEISEDASRNLLIAEAAVHLFDTGRDVLVLSDRIEHLKGLMVLCEYLGVPEEEMGLYAGYNPEFRYAKDATPQRRPHGHERGTEYTPISLQLIARRLKAKEKERIKDTARIIFSTYGMFAKGVDVPRLTGGIDATPRSKSEQVHGRILRGLAGSLRSIWITIADHQSYRSLFSVASRIPDYVRNNARIYRYSLQEGEIECNARALKAEFLSEIARLKTMKIVENRDGLLTLATQQQRIALDRQAVRDISERTARPPAVSPMASSRAVPIARSPVPTSNTRSSVSPSPFRMRRRR